MAFDEKKFELNNLAAEQAVLGAALFDPEIIDRFASLAPAHFFDPVHQLIYDTILAMRDGGKHVSPLTLDAALSASPGYQDAGGSNYLERLAANVPSTAGAPDFAEVVVGLALRRGMEKVGADIASSAQQAGYDFDAIRAVEEAESRLSELLETKTADARSKSMAAAFTSWMDRATERAGESPGYGMGLKSLDEQIQFRPGKLYIVAGRPGMGKSTLLNKIAAGIAETNDVGVAFSTLEMEAEDLPVMLITDRMRDRGIRLPYIQAENGIFSDDEFSAFAACGKEVAALPIEIDDTPSASLSHIRRFTRRARRKFHANGKKLGALVVDYLGLIEKSRDLQGTDRVAEITHGLLKLAKELDVPVIVGCQLNRQVESRDEKRPMLSDLRECVVGNTLVLMSDGSRLPIADLVGKRPRVLAIDNTGKITSARANRVFNKGKRRTFRVHLASGRIIECTADHRLLGFQKWVRLRDLKIGDRIAIARKLPEPTKNNHWSDLRLILLAHLIGDGSYLTNLPLRYTTGCEECSTIVRTTAEAEFGATVKRYEGRGNWHQLVISGNGNCKNPAGVNKWLRTLGVWNQRSADKTIPLEIFQLSTKQIALFLRHLWATDGTISPGGPGRRAAPATYFATASRSLADGVACLLLRVGIVGRIRKSGNCFQVWVRGVGNLKKFLNCVGAFGPRKPQAAALIETLKHRTDNTNVDTVPIEAFDLVKSSMRRRGITQRKMAELRGTAYGGNGHFGFSPSREVLADYAELLDDDNLRGIASSDIFWDKIASIEPSGEQDVYDLSVPGPTSWLADGIVSHNSGDIEQDAFAVIFVYRPIYYHQRQEPKKGGPGTKEAARHEDWEMELTRLKVERPLEVIIAKHRRGPTCTVELWCEIETAAIRDKGFNVADPLGRDKEGFI